MLVNEQAPALDAEEAMIRALEAEDDEPEEQEEEPVASDEPEEGDETEAEETEETEPEEADEEIVWNGEAQKLTKTELKALAQQGFDYTKKTQALAEERRVLALERQTLQAQAQIQEKTADIVSEVKSIDRQLANYKGVDWNALAENDPVEYLKHQRVYQDLKEARNEKVQEFQSVYGQEQQVVQQANAQRLALEKQRMAERIPEFRDPQKAVVLQGKMQGYLEQRGFNQAEIDTIADSRMVEVIYDALRYKGLVDTKPAVKKRIEAAPKSIKPGQGTNVQATANSELKKKLKATGSGEYAAKLIENML